MDKRILGCKGLGVGIEHFDYLHDTTPVSGNVLLGTLAVFGTPYHFVFVEVELVEGGYKPVKDPQGHLLDIEAMYVGQPLQLTEIPGRPGKHYVGGAHPHGA